jgi:type IX secretion system PorP/SprF family membrane protein
VRKLQYIFIFVAMLLAGRVSAQQDPIYTQYMNQMLTLNPAHAGSKGIPSASMVWREQWIGWNENPSTKTIYYDMPLSNETGIGGTFVLDEIGIERWIGLYLDYSYTITYPGQKYLSFGLKGGFSSYSANLDQLGMPDDPALSADINRWFLPNAGVGIYLTSPKYHLGFSVPKMINNKIGSKTIETNYVSREQMHAYLTAGYVFNMSRIIKFKPSFMMRMTWNAPISLDINGQFMFIDKYGLGVTYRVDNGFGFMTYLQLTQQIKLGLAYDLTTSDFRQLNNVGTMEVMLNFDFSFGRTRVRSARYF